MMFPNYPAFILAAPLAAGLIIGLLGSTNGQKVARLGVAAEVIAFVLALFLLFDVTVRGPQTFHLSAWNDGFLQFGLYVDRLSAVMLVHIAAISILIHLFSLRYMQQERGYARFHSLLAFTTFVLFGMEHYFSTVDQEVYGSGSKIYHNVVGRLGIMPSR